MASQMHENRTALPQLRGLNAWAFGLHAALAVALAVVFAARWDSTKFAFPVYHSTLEDKEGDGGGERGSLGYTPRLDEWFKIYVPILIILFPAITACFHLYYRLDPQGWYARGVVRGSQRLRWIEYAITATLMIVAVSLMSGLNTAPVLLAIIGLNVALMLQGTNVEEELARYGRVTHVARSSTFVGWLAAIILIVLIVTQFAKNISDSKNLGSDVPSWVYFVIIPSVLFYTSFGGVQFAQLLRPRTPYRKFEWWYMLLSFVSKAFLAIWVAVGLVQQTNNDD